MMISTPLRSKPLNHTRSVSLPNRSHPLIPQFNDHLHKLKAPDSTTSLSSLTKKLSDLENVYTCIDDLLLLPHTRQVFAQECREKWVEETLDGYLTLVDTCGTAREFVLQSKQDMQDLLSVLRRRRDVDDLREFLASRKRAKKTIQKSLKNISSFKSRSTCLALEKNQETVAVVSMLKEAESVTLDLIEALLANISGNSQKTRGWSLVTRLIHSRKSTGSSGMIDEFEYLAATVSKLVSKNDTGVQIDDLQHQLREMESNVQVVEERLECLLNRLVRTRVSLLNLQCQ